MLEPSTRTSRRSQASDRTNTLINVSPAISYIMTTASRQTLISAYFGEYGGQLVPEVLFPPPTHSPTWTSLAYWMI